MVQTFDSIPSRRLNVKNRRCQNPKIRKDKDRWVARYRHEVIENGAVKTIRPVWYGSLTEFPGIKEARKEFQRFLAEIESEHPLASSTFADFAKEWAKTVMIHHDPSTQVSERSHLKIHLIPAFGHLQLKQLTTPVLQAWIAEQTLESKTIRNILSTLSTMWTTAKAWGYVRHGFDGLRLPKKTRGKTYAFSLEETVAIINAAAEPWKTLLRIVAETGIRSGEVAGLRVEDFDPVNLTLSIRQSVWNRKIKAPKTDNAVRREPISPELAVAIQEHIDGLGQGSNSSFSTSRSWVGGDGAATLLFTNKAGRPLEMIHFMNRVFRPLLEKLGIRQKVEAMGIKQCGLHALRRMNGTEMDLQGVPLKTRQARLGHAHPSTTLEHYTKPIDEASRRFSARMGKMLEPKNGAVQ